MEAVSELAQLLQRRGELVLGAGEEARLLGIRVEAHRHEAQPQRQRDQALLGAVVEIALQPAALAVSRGDEARAELVLGLACAGSP